jgi:hypothetical protein
MNTDVFMLAQFDLADFISAKVRQTLLQNNGLA